MADIHFEYKSALHRVHAKDAVEREEERQIAKGRLAYTEEEYVQRLEYFLSRIPYKLTAFWNWRQLNLALAYRLKVWYKTVRRLSVL